MVGYGQPMPFAPMPHQGQNAFPQPIAQAPFAPTQQPQYGRPETHRQWQGTPSPAYLASGMGGANQQTQPLPYKARGVAHAIPGGRQLEPVKKAVEKFVMPSPEELGVPTTFSTAAPSAPVAPVAPVNPVAVPCDWNALHARMAKLRVLKFDKELVQATGKVRVTILLPTSDPTLAQPIVSVAASEGEAALAAVQYAEAWIQRR